MKIGFYWSAGHNGTNRTNQSSVSFKDFLASLQVKKKLFFFFLHLLKSETLPALGPLPYGGTTLDVWQKWVTFLFGVKLINKAIILLKMLMIN